MARLPDEDILKRRLAQGYRFDEPGEGLGKSRNEAMAFFRFNKKLMLNVGIQLIAVIAMLISTGYVSNLYSLIFFAFIIHASSGYTFNSFFTFCLSRFPNNAGIAGGLTGGINYVLVSFLSYGIIHVMPASDETNLAYSYLVLIILSVVTMLIIFLMARKTLKHTASIPLH